MIQQGLKKTKQTHKKNGPDRKGRGLSEMTKLSAKKSQVFHYHTLLTSQNMHLNMKITQPSEYRKGTISHSKVVSLKRYL